MRSRAIRLTFVIAAWLAIAAGTFFVLQIETHAGHELSSLRAFEQRAREAEGTLTDLRAAELAYVAEGQGLAFWMPKVATLSETASDAITALRQMGVGEQAKTALEEAASTLTEFGSVDKRAREYLKSGEPLMASDVIYTEGGEAAASAARQIAAASVAEQQRVDASQAFLRKREAMAGGAAAGLAAIVLLLLLPLPRKAAEATETTSVVAEAPRMIAPPAPIAARPAAAEPIEPRRSSLALKAAADLATDFGRVRDLDDLARLLGRAAHVMDAQGVVVWMRTAVGADLRAVLAHGYSAQAVARMPAVSRTGDNAAAAAYRTGVLQIVLARPGGASGAIVAPILSADGCIGALSAEIRGGGETSDSVQAVAAILAAQLAGVLAASSDVPETKTAAQG